MRRKSLAPIVDSSNAAIVDRHRQVAGKSTVSRDVTVQRAVDEARAEDVIRLRSLARRLMTMEESQKRMLGRELHDQIGGNLATLGLTLQLIRQHLAPSAIPVISPRLDFCDDLLRQTTGSIRAVLADLRPTALDELGLLASLRQLAGAMAKSGLLRFNVGGAEPSPRLGPDFDIALYRIAQEAFTNAVKHSGGTHVHARLSQNRKLILLRIVDNGRGLHGTSGMPESVGLGLTTMRERAEAMGASLEVTSGPSGGTAVTVRLKRDATGAQAPA